METYTTDCIHYQVCSPSCTKKCQLYEKARPEGEWVEGELKGCIACNICGCEFRYTFLVNCEPDFPNFCPECGADMRGDVNA